MSNEYEIERLEQRIERIQGRIDRVNESMKKRWKEYMSLKKGLFESHEDFYERQEQMEREHAILDQRDEQYIDEQYAEIEKMQQRIHQLQNPSNRKDF